MRDRRAAVEAMLERMGLDGPARSARGPIVGRLEAAPGARRLRAASAQTAAARRADGGRRRQGAARVLGPDPRHGRRRADDAGLDPLHGRGRALLAHRLSRARAHRRRRGARPRSWRSSGLIMFEGTGKGSTRRRARCAARPASRRPPCSAARCTSPAWIATRLQQRDRRARRRPRMARGRAAPRRRLHPHAQRRRRGAT